ncbi:ATPase [Azoarcus sp. CIB]|uniref:AAA family ATPase n=1 Tax=Aromatoleum sp. (strain CIB) TaxID=198107 RepID=UPI00067C23CD|nr:MoxR family ATPase [Azoarcus sp. CIB]AKU11257.1 ATPase [Azoarcus sp. CIB]
MSAAKSCLASLGVFGFEPVETVILAALVTEDPMILIGRSGTGKTYLLNSLSEALGLNHRHYNASLISFDDLVGFPYPDEASGGVRFLETPATVWGAESVLIDEISRCKPEHQNRLFSLVHERRIQGIALPKLRYRWAAMNPCSGDQDAIEEYAGSEPLDPALADRFALLVSAADWDDLSEDDRRSITLPGGEGRIADDGGVLKERIETWRSAFVTGVDSCPEFIVRYAAAATTALNGASVRISPRRARLIARSLFAATIVVGDATEGIFRTILRASLPQPCWGVAVAEEVLAAAHRVAWESATPGETHWIHRFLAERSLPRKLSILLDECRDPDAGTQAVSQLIAVAPREQSAAFAFAVYPAAAMGKLPIGPEGVNDLARLASPLLTTEGLVSWQERLNQQNSEHGDLSRYVRILSDLQGARYERAQQFFNACVVQHLVVGEPGALEKEIEGCVQEIRRRGLA